VPEVGEEEGAALSKAADAAVAALKQGNLGNFTVVGTEIVGPAIGEDLTRKGIYAFIASLVGILAYIAFRFRLSFAVGAIVATIHDILVTVAFLVFFGYEITLNVIAAILTVTGYSVNDTIVIFDRVRENARSQRRESVITIINTALNQTLSRTIITAGTTLVSVVALFLFGGEVLRGFAFAMIVGIISGTWSTIFIASTVVTLWQGRGKPAMAAMEPSPGVAGQPAAKRAKPARKARAS
jgi:preprotein translocase subunit SecF